MNHERVTQLALANGFKLKEQPDGSMALNPYVFEFVAALLAERAAPPTTSAKLSDFCGHMNAARDHLAAATLEFSKALAENHELKGRSTWRPLTPELLADIFQRDAGLFWLAGPGMHEPVVGEYEWRQGRNPNGFNTQDGGRVAAGWVTHVMPCLAPALPGA